MDLKGLNILSAGINYTLQDMNLSKQRKEKKEEWLYVKTTQKHLTKPYNMSLCANSSVAKKNQQPWKWNVFEQNWTTREALLYYLATNKLGRQLKLQHQNQVWNWKKHQNKSDKPVQPVAARESLARWRTCTILILGV